MFANAAFLHLMVSLSSYATVSNNFAVALQPMLGFRKEKKGKVMVECGKKQQVVWFIHSGSAKEVVPGNDDFSTRVTWFWFASDFMFSYPGFFAQEPALASIELVEDSELVEISFPDFMLLKEQFADLPLLVEKIRANYEKLRVAHAADLMNLTARERYQKFFDRHKPLFNVARHKDIASFLGIRDDGFHRYV